MEHYPEYSYLTAQNLRDQTTQALKCQQISDTTLTDTYNSEVNLYVTELQTANISNVKNASNNEIITTDCLTEIEKIALLNAKELVVDIRAQMGDMSKRKWRTRINNTPKDKDVKAVNKIVFILLEDIQDVINTSNYEQSLWLVDCVIYAAIISWYLQNSIKCENNSNKQYKSYTPEWLTKLEREIKELRKLISQCTAEIDRLKNRGRLTRKSKRNRKHFQELIGEISIYGLTKLMMKSKARIRRLAKSRKRKIKNEESRKLNNLFRTNQGKVFNKFKDIINSQKDVEYPVYKNIDQERKHFTDRKDVESFWRALWQKEDTGKPNALWLLKTYLKRLYQI